MAKGTVKWFNASKQMGFITPDDGGGDVFVRKGSLKESVTGKKSTVTRGRAQAPEPALIEGQRVSFETEFSDSGHVQATAVQAEHT